MSCLRALRVKLSYSSHFPSHHTLHVCAVSCVCATQRTREDHLEELSLYGVGGLTSGRQSWQLSHLTSIPLFGDSVVLCSQAGFTLLLLPPQGCEGQQV